MHRQLRTLCLDIPAGVRAQQAQLVAFVGNLGIEVEKIQLFDLFLTAFIHKSYAADFKVISAHNERLEFLGDGILEAVVCKLLFVNEPEMNEATMSLYKIALVREESLAQAAKKI